MSSFLMKPAGSHVIYKRRRYLVCPAYDTVLTIRKLYREEELEDSDKISAALELLAGNRLSRLRMRCLPVLDQAELLRKIFDELIQTKKRPKLPNHGPPVLDFDEDGEYIYASFMGEYGIDLLKARGRLGWREFIAMFEGLSGESKIKEVMRIRQMEIPAPDGKNQKEVQKLSQLKMYYALPVKGGQNGADLLFHVLERMAVKQ